MPVRPLDYVTQIFKAQLRAWSRAHSSFAGFRAQPVLPVVLYTGMARWESPGRLLDLIELGEPFRAVTPDFEPLFVNLAGLPAERLVSAGGSFGRVLRLLQVLKARLADFRRELQDAVRALEAMPEAERLRWLELLSYIHMLVYHEREEAEHRRLHEAIEASVETDPQRQEVKAVAKTIAQEMEEKGRRKGRREEAISARQQTLLRQLRTRFGELPEPTAAAVRASRDVGQLDAWLERFAVARTLEDVGIQAAP
jgi:hypothetical protein